MTQQTGRILLLQQELRKHAPFTLLGAATGIALMWVFSHVSGSVHHRLFQFFHPAHVLLSALVTTSLYRLRAGGSSLWATVLIGYFGSIGVATLSDCVVPFAGERVLGVAVVTHASLHESGETEDLAGHTDREEHAEHERAHGHGHDHRGGLHLGFIEDWYLVNPAALAGILLALVVPHGRLHTALPHTLHVLLSTWASSFHILMNTPGPWTWTLYAGFFIVLFIAVWLPCCISDIVFPLLFVGRAAMPTCCHGPRVKRPCNEPEH